MEDYRTHLRAPLPPDQLRVHSARTLSAIEANGPHPTKLQVTCTEKEFWPGSRDELARLGDALGTNTHLSTVTLIDDNAGSLTRFLAGNQGFFDGLARNSSLSRLLLVGLDFAAGSDPAMLGQLVPSSGNDAHDVNITLLSCTLGNGAAGALASAVASRPNATYELDLGGCGIEDDIIEDMVSGIQGCRNPLKLTFYGHGGGITTAGFGSLASLLRDRTCNLTSLQVAEIPLDDDRAEILAVALKGNATLEILILENFITTQNWQSLARALCDDSCPNETYHSNHTLHTIKQRVPGLGMHDRDVPPYVKRMLLCNQSTKKNMVAIGKVLKCHPVLDMTPFIQEWDLRMLPIVVDWFGMVQRRRPSWNGIVGDRKLTSIYQFVRFLPLMVVPYPNTIV